MLGPSVKGCGVHKPVDTLTLSAEAGEALIARVYRSDLPRADAETVEWVIRMYFHVVFALQEAKLSVKRLRVLLFGTPAAPAPLPAASRAPRQPDAAEASCAGLTAEAETDQPAHHVSPVAAQTPGQATPKGGHRPGTGRLGAAAYAGATRMECRHEELAEGQRCPVCGQGTLYQLPAGVEIRLDGNALRSAMHYTLEKLRCSACGEIFTAG
jgi:hypothetical protein